MYNDDNTNIFILTSNLYVHSLFSYFLYDWLHYKNKMTKDKNYQKICLHIMTVFKLTPTIKMFYKSVDFISLVRALRPEISAIQQSCKVIMCGKLNAWIKGFCLWCITLVVKSSILQYF